MTKENSTIDKKFEQEGVTCLDVHGMYDFPFFKIDTDRVARQVKGAGYEIGSYFRYKLTIEIGS